MKKAMVLFQRHGSAWDAAKPVREQDLLYDINVALERNSARRKKEEKTRMLRASLELLNDRERELMSLVITGLLNKQIAGEMKLSEVTVKVYRHTLMKKLGAKSVPEPVRMANVLGVAPRGTVR